jgi:hypothetical protein
MHRYKWFYFTYSIVPHMVGSYYGEKQHSLAWIAVELGIGWFSICIKFKEGR